MILSSVPLNIDWQQILLHLFNFVILTGGLYFLLYKPVKDFMNKRQAHFKEIEDEAAGKIKEAEEIKAKYEAGLRNAEIEAANIKHDAMAEAKKASEATIADAWEQRDKIIAKAKEDAQREQQKAVHDAKDEIAALAVAAAEKILREEAAHE